MTIKIIYNSYNHVLSFVKKHLLSFYNKNNFVFRKKWEQFVKKQCLLQTIISCFWWTIERVIFSSKVNCKFSIEKTIIHLLYFFIKNLKTIVIQFLDNFITVLFNPKRFIVLFYFSVWWISFISVTIKKVILYFEVCIVRYFS